MNFEIRETTSELIREAKSYFSASYSEELKTESLVARFLVSKKVLEVFGVRDFLPDKKHLGSICKTEPTARSQEVAPTKKTNSIGQPQGIAPTFSSTSSTPLSFPRRRESEVVGIFENHLQEQPKQIILSDQKQINKTQESALRKESLRYAETPYRDVSTPVEMTGECFVPLKTIKTIKSVASNYPTPNPQLHFSISHKKNHVAIIVSEKPIGIDLEILKKRNKSLFTYFTEKEWKNLEGKNWKNFYFLWTAKEALIKKLKLKLDSVKDINLIKKEKNELTLEINKKNSHRKIKKCYASNTNSSPIPHPSSPISRGADIFLVKTFQKENLIYSLA